MPRCEARHPILILLHCLTLCSAQTAIAQDQSSLRADAVSIGYSSALTAEQVHADHLTTSFAQAFARDITMNAMGGTPAMLVAQAIEAQMSVLAVPFADGTAICAALTGMNRVCTGVRDSDRSALIGTAGAMDDFNTVFETPQLLDDTAMVWPPTALLGGFLRWMGVPERQVPDMLSTQRGFDYAYQSLFEQVTNPIWCNSSEGAIALFARGDARAVLVKTSRIDDVVAAADRSGTMSDLSIWESAHLTLSEPQVLWFDLRPAGPGDPDEFMQFASDHGYTRFDTAPLPRADAPWRTALNLAHIDDMPSPKQGQTSPCKPDDRSSARAGTARD